MGPSDKNLKAKVPLFAVNIINAVPNIGISVLKLGNGLLLSNIKNE